MSWRAALTLLLALTALASGWSIWTQSHPDESSTLRARSDYVLRDYELTSLGKNGRELFTLRGPLLQRDPTRRSLTLATPKFLVPDSEGAYWEVQADEGLVPPDGDHLEVRGRVSAQSPASKPPPTRIEATQLTLDLERNRATSAGKVTITRPGLTMEGTGLAADFDRRTVSLLSQVHNRYAPQH